MIPYGRQNISKDDIDAVLEVLSSDFITQGPKVPEFEESLCNYTGAKFASVCNSATSALHIACLALGLSKDDILWTSPITFVASSNAALYCGAKVDFVDIDPLTYNMCPLKLEEKLLDASKKNILPKIIIPVHLCGQSCDMKKIKELCDKYDVKVIEDASHAIGGKYLNEPIGNCRYSDITVFSFHPVKIITTAEGGAALTNQKGLQNKMNLLRSHGITKNDAKMIGEGSHGSWYYQQIDLGFNYRMTDIQAALGISQLKRIDTLILKRHEIASTYNDAFDGVTSVKTPYQLSSSYSSYHLYVIRLQLKNINKTHKEFFEELRNKGIGVNLHYIPVHLHPFYLNFGFKNGDFPNSERYYSEAISLPMYPDLSFDDQEFVIRSIIEIASSS